VPVESATGNLQRDTGSQQQEEAAEGSSATDGSLKRKGNTAFDFSNCRYNSTPVIRGTSVRAR
jgi:hypothetical protein